LGRFAPTPHPTHHLISFRESQGKEKEKETSTHAFDIKNRQQKFPVAGQQLPYK